MDRFREAVVYDENGKESDRFVISDHVDLELSRFEAARARCQIGRPVLYWYPAADFRIRIYRIRYMAFALADINAAASELQAAIQSAFVDFSRESEQLMDKHRSYEQDEALHYKRLCMNKIMEAKKRFITREIWLYKAVIALLNRKIRLLKNMRSRVRMIESKTYLMIRYYYQCAALKETKLPVQYLGDERMMRIANVSTVFPYDQELRDTQKMVDTYEQELGMLN